MVPDATAVANAGTMIGYGNTTAPVLAVILAAIVVLGLSAFVVSIVRRSIPRR